MNEEDYTKLRQQAGIPIVRREDYEERRIAQTRVQASGVRGDERIYIIRYRGIKECYFHLGYSTYADAEFVAKGLLCTQQEVDECSVEKPSQVRRSTWSGAAEPAGRKM